MFPELAPPDTPSGEAHVLVRTAANAAANAAANTAANAATSNASAVYPFPPQPQTQPPPQPQTGHLRSTLLSFSNIHSHGELLVDYLAARKRVFIDRLRWSVPYVDAMEFDQYDNPFCRWMVIHEYGEVLGGIRFSPTTARVGCYSYMLRDAQLGLLRDIPNDVLFFDAPVSPTIWEASRFFISEAVPTQRRRQMQTLLVEKLNSTGYDLGASHVIGIVPAVWSRWVRRLDLDLGAIPAGSRFSIDGTASQAVLFRTGGKKRRAA